LPAARVNLSVPNLVCKPLLCAQAAQRSKAKDNRREREIRIIITILLIQ
jgi:hypothetical protein